MSAYATSYIKVTHLNMCLEWSKYRLIETVLLSFGFSNMKNVF